MYCQIQNEKIYLNIFVKFSFKLRYIARLRRIEHILSIQESPSEYQVKWLKKIVIFDLTAFK